MLLFADEAENGLHCTTMKAAEAGLKRLGARVVNPLKWSRS